MKRIFCLLIALLMMVAIAGCSGKESVSSGGESLKKDDSNDYLQNDSQTVYENTSSIANFEQSMISNTSSKGNATNTSSKQYQNSSKTSSSIVNISNGNVSGNTSNIKSESNTEELVIKVDDNIFGNKPTLTQAYIYPAEKETILKNNSSGIYENKYVKIDSTTGKDGYVLVTYKDVWADSLWIVLDESNVHSGFYEKTYHFRYNQGTFKANEPLAIPLSKTDALYYITVCSTINGFESDKMSADLGQITKKGTASYQDMVPSEEQIKFKHVTTGVYSNKYVTINTNTASKGYIEVEYTEPNGFDIEVSMTCTNKNENNNNSCWHYYTKFKGKCKIKAALTYGDGEYTISVSSTMKNESTGVGRASLKGTLTTSFTGVSETGAFLLSTGEVIYDSNTLFVKKAAELSKGCKNDFEKVSKIYDWITSYIEYGSEQFTGLGVYTCNLDNIYNKKQGVCYDYAVALAAMLRSQNIPCKVVFGRYEGGNELVGHAWNEIYINNSGSMTTNKLSITGKEWCTLDPTLSVFNTGEYSNEFMNNPNNYRCLFYY